MCISVHSWFKILRLPRQSSDLFKRCSKFVVVHLYAIIEVDLDLLGGQWEEDVAVVVLQFFQLLVQFSNLFQGFGLFCFRCVATVGKLLQGCDLRAQFGEKIAEVVVEDDADGVALVAVHVDQGVEGAFGAAEEPVDGPLFVELDVVLVKLLEEIVADGLPFFTFEVCRVCLLYTSPSPRD